MSDRFNNGLLAPGGRATVAANCVSMDDQYRHVLARQTSPVMSFAPIAWMTPIKIHRSFGVLVCRM